MASVNKVILIGRLGRDPELRYTQGGQAVANFTLATNERFANKSGEQQERTEWHRVAIFGRLAEIAAEYLRKGSQVYIEGRLRTRKWQDNQGNDRYSTEIVASEMQMLGSRSGMGEPPVATERSGETGRHPAATAPAEEFDDDIPF